MLASNFLGNEHSLSCCFWRREEGERILWVLFLLICSSSFWLQKKNYLQSYLGLKKNNKKQSLHTHDLGSDRYWKSCLSFNALLKGLFRWHILEASQFSTLQGLPATFNCWLEKASNLLDVTYIYLKINLLLWLLTLNSASFPVPSRTIGWIVLLLRIR